MSKKTVIYVVCDECGEEKPLLSSHVPNKDAYRKAVSAVGFIATKDYDYCNALCKLIHQSRMKNG